MLGLNSQLSPSYKYFFILIIILSAFISMVSEVPDSLLRTGLLLTALSYFGYLIYHDGLQCSKDAIRHLVYSQKTGWQIKTVQGWYLAKLRKDSTTMLGVCVLRFEIAGEKRPLSCLVFSDSLKQGAYRQMMKIVLL